MKQALSLLLAIGFFSIGNAQVGDSISLEDVTRIVSYLASDSLKGRGNFTPELYKAARFISNEFSKDSLTVLPGSSNYFQPFLVDPYSGKGWLKDSAGNYNSSLVLVNVIGLIEGKTRPGEAIIFSAHYDHVGVSDGFRDSIYNGANDDASGTTALLELAHYYSMRKDNARTLIFCAFAGEELGLFGSSKMVQTINPDKIVAMINIEMIGVAARKNSFFITGSGYSDVPNIIRKNLEGRSFTIRKEPDLSKNLFARSDNYPFALKGVPAHTIMGSDDDDPCYHQPCDEVRHLDLGNMTELIRMITIGVNTLVNGKDTPSRIK